MKKILILDDDITSLDIISFLFEKGGYEVKKLPDGHVAIGEVRTFKPDLLLVDIMMPNINGVETVKIMRRDGLKAPIIAFTAVSDSEVHQEALDAGCTKVLIKPYPTDLLLETVKELI
jgi:CheY-like chemotaxis protein